MPVLSGAQTERGNTGGGATKKREISCTSLNINLHFSVHTPWATCVLPGEGAGMKGTFLRAAI